MLLFAKILAPQKFGLATPLPSSRYLLVRTLLLEIPFVLIAVTGQEMQAYVFAGAETDIFIWGATGGASFAKRGAVNGLCRTFRKRPEKFWKVTGGTRQNFGGQCPPPSFDPASLVFKLRRSYRLKAPLTSHPRRL